MRRSIFLGVVIAVTTLLPIQFAHTQSARPVSGLSNSTRCNDGIGETISYRAFYEALDVGEADALLEEASACVGPTGADASFLGFCAPATQVEGVDTLIVFCRLEINNDSDLSIPYGAESFTLITDSERYPVSQEFDDLLMVGLPPLTDTSPEIESGGGIVTFVPFEIAAEALDQPRAVVWHAPEVLIGESGQEPTILVGTDEPGILSVVADQAEVFLLGPNSAGNGNPAEFYLSGAGDTLTIPIKFETGIYTFAGEHDGSYNFIVTVIFEDGTSDQLINSLGEYDGEVSLRVANSSRALLEVKADGEWEIEIGPAF